LDPADNSIIGMEFLMLSVKARDYMDATVRRGHPSRVKLITVQDKVRFSVSVGFGRGSQNADRYCNATHHHKRPYSGYLPPLAIQ
jgi:hypothetical protein